MPSGAFEDGNYILPGFTAPGSRSTSSLSGALSAPKNPFADAANVQVDALNNAIPFFQPFMDAGLSGLEQYQQGSTPEGLEQILSMIMGGDTFGSLVDERTRAVEGGLAAGGLTRSGAAIKKHAAIPTDIALALEGILSGRSGALADTGFGASSGIAGLTTRVGEAIASGILGKEAQDSSRSAQKSTNTSDIVGAVLGGVFSDPRLKENKRKIGKIGPLDLYDWDWIPEVKDTIAAGMPTTGFLSTDIKEHFPEYVSEFGGFDLIDFQGLINHMEESCHS